MSDAIAAIATKQSGGPLVGVDRLGALRARVLEAAARGDHAALDGMLAEVHTGMDRVLDEHAGMSQEVLTLYEQLGVVFEVTRKAPEVQGETEVIQLVVDSLGQSFSGCRASSSSYCGTVGGWSFAAQPYSPSCLALLEEARDSGRVVASRSAVGTKEGQALVGPVFSGGDFVCVLVLLRESGREFRASDMMLLEALTVFCGDLIRNHRLVCELRETSLVLVRALVNAVDQKDEYTSGHSIRVGFYSTLLGRRLGLSAEELQMLQWSALLHDVGKIGIRDEVLKKPDKLTAAEFDHIKEHPVRSHRVVKEVPQLAKALDGVLHHHERWDGRGYPSGLVAENIPLQARIIQLADIFDALTSTRSYRMAYDYNGALDILVRESGKATDPLLTREFEELIRCETQQDKGGWPGLFARANAFASGRGELQTANKGVA